MNDFCLCTHQGRNRRTPELRKSAKEEMRKIRGVNKVPQCLRQIRPYSTDWTPNLEELSGIIADKVRAV